jgi:hypothetical protein
MKNDMSTKKLKKGTRVRCPYLGGEWAKVSLYPSGRVEIKYPGKKYGIEVDADSLVY